MIEAITADWCSNGHDRNVVGTYARPNNGKVCRVCHRDALERSKAKKQAERRHDEELLPEEVERFRRKIDRSADGCWNWTGADNGNKYGVVQVAGKNKLAHRVSYRLHVGPVADGLELDHLCRNRSCVNPAHLEPVTHAENNRRAHAKEVCLRGHNDWVVYPSRTTRHCRTCNVERKRARRTTA